MTYTDACAILAVREDAPPEVAEAAFRALSKQRHPDAGGSNVLMSALNTAIEVFRKGPPPTYGYHPNYRFAPEDFQFRYGKYAGQWMSDVPLDYLRWWAKNKDGNEYVRECATEWLDWRRGR